MYEEFDCIISQVCTCSTHGTVYVKQIVDIPICVWPKVHIRIVITITVVHYQDKFFIFQIQLRVKLMYIEIWSMCLRTYVCIPGIVFRSLVLHIQIPLHAHEIQLTLSTA